MQTAQPRPCVVQNSAIWQEQLQLQDGDLRSSDDVSLKHPTVAVYLRVSTEDQSVQAQKSMLHGYLLVHGYELTECRLYIDEGVSARDNPSFTDRPEGRRMMQDIKDGKITHVFGYKVDRFFRKMSAGATWLDLMCEKFPKITIQTTDCAMPTNSAAGRMSWHMLLMMSEAENETKSERGRAGMQAKQENLQKTAHAVFGWSEYDSGERNFTNGRDVGPLIMMKPCWHEQAVIEWMTEAVKNGKSMSAVARELNSLRIPTSTGRTWTPTTVSRLVNKPPKMQDQLHQFERPARMLSHPFRGFRAAQRLS